MHKNDKNIKLKIVHINDTHSHFEPSPLQINIPLDKHKTGLTAACGGYSLIDSFTRRERSKAQQEKAGFLFVHAGDSFEGSVYFSCFKGAANAAVLNAMQLDAMAVGNHELDTGDELLADFINQVDFPLLSANMRLKKDGGSALEKCTGRLLYQSNEQHKPAYLTKVINGISIAVFALSITDMHDIASPGPAVDFSDHISCAQSMVSEIQDAGINCIIVISHLGYTQDKRLAETVNGISLIIGGHSHTLQGDFSNIGLARESAYAQAVNNCYIVQAGHNAMAAGCAELTLAPAGKIISISGGNKLLLEKNSLTINSPAEQSNLQAAERYLTQQANISFENRSDRVEQLLERDFRPAVEHYKNDIVGHVLTSKRHLRVPDQQGGSQVAPIVAQSLLHYARKHNQDVDFAIINAGAVRTHLLQSAVSAADISGKLLPFSISVQSYQVSGETLFEAVNSAVKSSVDPAGSTGSYPYFSNLSIKLRSTELTDGIRKLYQQDAQGEISELQMDKLYSIVTTGYMSRGKGGYQALMKKQEDVFDFGIKPADAFTHYLRELKTLL
ncbi:bifunctional metallophosphatase/5'-nucleotidase [Psychromonas aquimarina]|uniref:bifunctional metallophosphatase/5'-nucleotidase n=1 Tax=Psychromonas aquimarina TaxID=444919 RepID=UPI000403DE23|nr:5'-nucleotidase C-terminal domain-containing protein [Psychromonas aquimarina]